MNVADIKIMKLPHAVEQLPSYESEGAAGMDLCAAIDEDIILASRAWVKVPSGICIALPPNYEAQIRPRSGLAAKKGITILNAPGTIDSDYRGEVQVILINHGTEAFTIQRGARIAQMIIMPITRAKWQECEALAETPRGAGGFGSTGGFSKTGGFNKTSKLDRGC